jgi:peroxiredoxin
MRAKFLLFVPLMVTISRGIQAKTVQSENIGYGSYIKPVSIANSDGRDTELSQKGVVSVLFFFNIDSATHNNILNKINYLIMNLDDSEKLRLYGISKGRPDAFEQIRAKYTITFDLINDDHERIYNEFNYSCSSCIQIIVVDRESKIRYLSTSFDPILLREVIQRYVDK